MWDARSAGPDVSPGPRDEDANSERLFTPGESKALAKSKVRQGLWARDYGSWVDLTDLKNMAVCQEWDKQDFNFPKHIFGKSRFPQWALKQFMFEEMRKNYWLCNIIYTYPERKSLNDAPTDNDFEISGYIRSKINFALTWTEGYVPFGGLADFISFFSTVFARFPVGRSAN
jgi:hypothetical protein